MPLERVSEEAEFTITKEREDTPKDVPFARVQPLTREEMVR
jgi:hypothetical protein